MCSLASIRRSSPINPQNEARMKRATLIATALGIFSVSGGAQNPAPPTPAQPSQPVTAPTPAPRAKKVLPPPSTWESIDFSDMNERLEDMKLDLDLNGIGDMALEAPMALDMDFDLQD